jgi:hypothetical protein
MSILKEKRRFTRVVFGVESELTVNNIKYVCNQIRNLSVGGCFLKVEAEFEPGTECQVRIKLQNSNNDIGVFADGLVIRCTSEGVAVKFVKVDYDNLFHLQNIICYNSSDLEKVEEEMRKHPGLV